MGLVLVSPEKITIEKSLQVSFSATNNEAEYEALLMGMMTVQKMGGKKVKVFQIQNWWWDLGSTRSKNVGILGPSQEYTNKI